MTQFRKKPVVITAITFDQLVAHGIEQCKAEGRESNIVNGMPWSFSYAGHPVTHENDSCYLIPTLEGTMKMGRDDMLITGVKGEIYPCKRDIFEATYDTVAPSAGLNFGHALEAIKAGLRIARSGWNGKGMFVYLVPPARYPVQTGAAREHFGEGALVPYNAYMAIKNVDNTVSTWVPSVNDCLATDWGVVGVSEQAAINESSHDWRHSSSYGGQLCADCGAVKGSRRGGLECSDPHAGVETVALPVVDPGPDSLEREIQAKANRAPRVTPAALQAEIVSAWYINGATGVVPDDFQPAVPADSPLSLLTICVLVLRNGFTVHGVSACASPENFNEEIGRRIARENAEREIWPLLGFRLRDELARPVLTEADAAADLAGTPRPDNPTAESADFLANVKACDLSGDAPCEACQ